MLTVFLLQFIQFRKAQEGAPQLPSRPLAQLHVALIRLLYYGPYEQGKPLVHCFCPTYRRSSTARRTGMLLCSRSSCHRRRGPGSGPLSSGCLWGLSLAMPKWISNSPWRGVAQGQQHAPERSQQPRTAQHAPPCRALPCRLPQCGHRRLHLCLALGLQGLHHDLLSISNTHGRRQQWRAGRDVLLESSTGKRRIGEASFSAYPLNQGQYGVIRKYSACK